MGLFDRFKKRVIETDQKIGITAEEGSTEAEEALETRKQNLIEKPEETPTREQNTTPEESAWDEFDEDELEDPFANPKTARDRKRAQRERKIRTKNEKKETRKPQEPMQSTTGRKLVKMGKPNFSIDLGDDQKLRGGRVIKWSSDLENILDELEMELMSADMGHSAVSDLTSALRADLVGSRVSRRTPLEEVIERAIRKSLINLLEAGYWDFDSTIKALATDETPVVIMIVGVNGTGKTTTSAKIAKRLKDQSFDVVLAAADTFRAGAIDQLSSHADRLGVRCVKSQRGGDSAAIARDAIESASARGEDVVIVDTAGRMQNKSNLMEELRKVHRVTKPHLVIFVADALAGNDAVTQASEFQRMISFDGAALCKLDTDARGGAALSIAHATGRPIVLAGTGQGYGDLEQFDPSWLIDNILS